MSAVCVAATAVNITNPVVIEVSYMFSRLSIKVTGYLCVRRAKCIGKCILKLANQESLVQRA